MDLEQPQPDPPSLLATRICDLGLKMDGSQVEKFVQQLYRELEQKRIVKFRPGVYLTDEWGCPSGEPVIGIPFYLARADLGQIERENNDLETDREVMMYLRHEAGHAFNYAYRLHRTPQWKQLFGPYRRPYRENYRPVLFSKDYVRYLPGWYAQKHPDEDFAETFAVWLTPRSRWRQGYEGWPALRKLLYVDRRVATLGDREPLVRLASADITVEEMTMTVEEFFRQHAPASRPVDAALDHDLPDLFGTREGDARPAAEFLRRHRAELVNKIEYWTGVPRTVVRSLVVKMEETAMRLELGVPAGHEDATLVELTAYATTLTMNFLTYGRFLPRSRARPSDHAVPAARRSHADRRRARR